MLISTETSDNSIMLMINREKRSISPMTPSPSRELRGIKLFKAISKKLTRRSHEELNFSGDADSRSSSTDDSCSSTSTGRCSRVMKIDVTTSPADSGFRSISPHVISSCSSDTSSEGRFSRGRHHSTSTDSVRRVFQNLTINNRSNSCNNVKENKRKTSNKKKTAPKRILRSPVTYTYVKGLSGLPTQRIPTTTTKKCRVYLNNTCTCNLQHTSGLNR